jgi:MATE family multidrug resistance protein
VRAADSFFRREILPTLVLGVPVVFGQIGVMAMGLVDTAVVGRLGPDAIGAVGVGTAVFYVVYLFGMGLLMGLDRVVSYAWGAGRRDDCRRALVQGLVLATGASAFVTAVLLFAASHLTWLGVPAPTAGAAERYLAVLAFSVWPSLLYTALRQTLQATGDTLFAAVVAVVANGVNLAANLALVFGRWGAPALGVEGSAWATLGSRTFMFLALGAYVLFTPLGRPRLRAPKPDLRVLRELLVLGLPSALQMAVESGVFSAATLVVSRLGSVPLAAHQVVMLVASFTFQMPLGMAAAGAVRVGQALGAGDARAARRAGWTAVALGVGLMCCAAVVLLTASRAVASVFSPDAEVTALGARLLLVAGFFQLFDGAQVTLAGVLRGAGDTRTAMFANLAGHWLCGMPLGLVLAFKAGLGALGLWIGLATGLAGTAVLLLFAWRRVIGRVVRAAEVQALPPG